MVFMKWATRLLQWMLHPVPGRGTEGEKRHSLVQIENLKLVILRRNRE